METRVHAALHLACCRDRLGGAGVREGGDEQGHEHSDGAGDPEPGPEAAPEAAPAARRAAVGRDEPGLSLRRHALRLACRGRWYSIARAVGGRWHVSYTG